MTRTAMAAIPVATAEPTSGRMRMWSRRAANLLWGMAAGFPSAPSARGVPDRRGQDRGHGNGQDPPGGNAGASDQGGDAKGDGDSRGDAPVIADDELPHR